MRRHLLRKLCLVVPVFLVAAARGDVMLTLDGRLLDGMMQLDSSESLTFVQRVGPNVQVPLSRLLSVRVVPPSPLRRGVVLTSGSAIAASGIASVDERTIRLDRQGGKPVNVALTQVASLIFQPVPSGLALPESPGILLKSGDVFEGELLSLAGGSVSITSTLFGDRAFPLDDVLAVRIGREGTPAGPYVVRMKDGSVARSPSLRITGNRFVFEDPIAGQLAAAREEVADITRTTDLLRPLPSPTDPPVLASGAPLRIRGEAPWDAPSPNARLALAAGKDHTVGLDGAYTAMFLRAAVPAALIPVQQVRLSILLDNQRVYRSPVLSSISDPVLVAVPLTDKGTLTFHLETESGALAAEMLCADIVLVHK